MNEPAPVVSLQNLEHAYGRGAPVLHGLDLTVSKGEMVAVIGLSGAGKSTLLRCLNGLVKPTGGTCQVLGQEVTRLSGRDTRLLRRRIGMIFQEFNLVDRLTALKNVLIGRLGYSGGSRSLIHSFSAQDVALAEACLEHVGLEHLAYRRVREMSGGQKQRVAIARTMAQQAELVLADEATANLDVLTKGGIMQLLRDMVQQQEATVILSMHDLPLAQHYCTRIVGLKGGRIMFDATPDQLDDAAIRDVLGDTALESQR